jgi:hypothetical protein
VLLYKPGFYSPTEKVCAGEGGTTLPPEHARPFGTTESRAQTKEPVRAVCLRMARRVVFCIALL